ncbi:sigma-70 family RNA polymerase sigma factor [Pseudoclavibacter chungangensis]|uniref:Sigma-70 family RNA polymerase sigma factor n=1 Tax=Pseudoclavibacter chungangensis TaxID=587635 RepID=A0A7J5C033_9MICO|nr:sigma-70 family RNA polymerase sigma factor [Pseudoclavibacter chungangensis]NYJ65609.1 RNA polymerase sigma factor (sigma-70 family) [Pseudoclavibacter chungangensis]
MRTPFDRAVRAHGETVLRVCRASLGATADAEDAWSETFLAALRAWPELPDDSNVEAWLVRVAQRKCIDIVRARAHVAIPVAELPERPSTIGRPGVRDLDLWDAVAALPERQRLAVSAHHLAGLTHAETAALIGGTPDAARRACADGIRTLRRRAAREDPLAEGTGHGSRGRASPRTSTGMSTTPGSRTTVNTNTKASTDTKASTSNAPAVTRAAGEGTTGTEEDAR